MAERTYTRSGDYLFPNLQLHKTGQLPLGKYGRLRRSFLQQSNPMLYSDLVLTENLYPHLMEIQETANRRMEQLMNELLVRNPAPDRQSDQMRWVQHMNSLRAQAEEMILNELIYS